MNLKIIGLITAVLIALGGSLWVYGNQNRPNQPLAIGNQQEMPKLPSQPTQANDTLATANSTKNTEKPTKSTQAKGLPSQDTLYLSDSELRARLNTIRQRRPDLNLTVEQLQALIKKPDAWHIDNSIEAELGDKLKPGDTKDGRVFIRFDPLKIETLIANDRLAIPIPHMKKTFTMVIDEVDSDDPGLTVWRGKLEDFDGINRVNIIQGNENGQTVTHIGINTPDGFYVTDVFDDKGWIIPGGTLTNKGGEVVIPIDENGVEGEPEFHGVEKTANNSMAN